MFRDPLTDSWCPIVAISARNLTANWNVPLAEYLENYYEELTELHIDIDGQTAKVSKDSNINPFDV